jgi:hypothetical protein
MTQIRGYTDRLSYVPGDEVQIFVSTDAPRYALSIRRVGKTEPVWRDEIPGRSYAVPPDADSYGCGWPCAITVPVEQAWRSGFYVLAMEPSGGDLWETGFVVRAAQPGTESAILLVLATNTHQAYNTFNGGSFYPFPTQLPRVSFRRPLDLSLFNSWERPFISWAERSGYLLDYAVNSDLEFHSEILQHYGLILSVGHDEYWSSGMRDHLEEFIARGGNVAFFSGNTVCWQVRFEENGSAMVCWKRHFEGNDNVSDSRLLSTLWSHHRVNRPENFLTGVGMLFGGYHLSHGQILDGSGAFVVRRPEHWIFDGTSLAAGDTFGGDDTIVGYECDGCEFEVVNGRPVPTHRDGTPRSFEILGTQRANWGDEWNWYDEWPPGGREGAAVLGVYTRGGTVFTAGTTDWAHGLQLVEPSGQPRIPDPHVDQITRNVLNRLAALGVEVANNPENSAVAASGEQLYVLQAGHVLRYLGTPHQWEELADNPENSAMAASVEQLYVLQAGHVLRYLGAPHQWEELADNPANTAMAASGEHLYVLQGGHVLRYLGTPHQWEELANNAANHAIAASGDYLYVLQDGHVLRCLGTLRDWILVNNRSNVRTIVATDSQLIELDTFGRVYICQL